MGWKESVKKFRERVGEMRAREEEASRERVQKSRASREARETERDRRSREELSRLKSEEAKLRTRKQLRETKGRVQRMRMEESPLGRLALGAKPQRPQPRPRVKPRAKPSRRSQPRREEPDFGFMGMNPFDLEPPRQGKRRRGPSEPWP